MDSNNPTIVFNISGGNNQILPNATKAEQHFYGDRFVEQVRPDLPAQPSAPSESETRLGIYINKVEDCRRNLAKLHACQSAAEVGRTVVQMVLEKSGLTAEKMVSKGFIEILLALTPSVSSGRTIENYRKYINTAWANKRN